MHGGAESERGVGIDGAVALVDKPDDALLVDDDVGAHSPLIGFIVHVVAFENAVTSEHLAVHVAEERERQADLLGESGVGRGTIQADAKDFRIRSVDSTGGDSSLDRLKLFRSTLGEGQDVHGEEDVFLAAVVAEFHGLPLIAEKSEIGSGVAHFQSHLGHLRFFDLVRHGRRGNRSG